MLFSLHHDLCMYVCMYVQSFVRAAVLILIMIMVTRRGLEEST